MAFWTLMAKLGLDTTAYQAGMKRAESIAVASGQKMRSSLASAAAGYIGTAAILALTKRTVDYASSLSDASDRLDVTTESLQEFYWAAEKSGGSVEGVNTFLEKLAENKRKALMNPTGEQADAFTQLGITVEQLRKGRIEDLTRQIGKLFETGDPQKLLGALKQIGGKGAGSFSLALIDGLQRAGDEARELGMIIDDGTVRKLDELGDKLTEIGRRTLTAMADPIVFAFGLIEDGVEFVKVRIDELAAVLVVLKQDLKSTKEMVSDKGFWRAIALGDWKTAAIMYAGTNQSDVGDRADYVKNFKEEEAGKRAQTRLAQEEYARRRRELMAGLRGEDDDTMPDAVIKQAAEKRASRRGGVDDPLAKIGGLFLGADAAMRSLGEKQLSEAKKSNRHLEKISGALSKPVA